MSHPQMRQTRTLQHLRKGDIVWIDAPFEENTRDYYNGYHPKAIRGNLYTDRFGRTGKSRMVMYLGRDERLMFYLPLTSSAGNYFDPMYQYKLTDNSMTYKPTPDTQSFVETAAVRVVGVHPMRPLPYDGRVTKEDLGRILYQVTGHSFRMEGTKDRRGYISDPVQPTWETMLLSDGYRKVEKEDRIVYKKSGHIITRTQYGMVSYHQCLTKEEVREKVQLREGIELPPLSETEVKGQKEPVPVIPPIAL